MDGNVCDYLRIDGLPCESCQSPTTDAGLYCVPCRSALSAYPEAYVESSLLLHILKLLEIRNHPLSPAVIRAKLAGAEHQARGLFEMQQRRRNDAQEGAEVA